MKNQNDRWMPKIHRTTITDIRTNDLQFRSFYDNKANSKHYTADDTQLGMKNHLKLVKSLYIL